MSRLIYDPALRWSADGREIRPNLCWRYEVSDDSREFTFHLRQGVRWSDGAPLTVEDVRFWWEDIILNKELNPIRPAWVQIEGKLPRLDILGPHRFRFVFPKPYGLFLERVAWRGAFWSPKHYLMRFHRKYRSGPELKALARKAGFHFWFQLFLSKSQWSSNPELPMTSAWIARNNWASAHKVFVRNPYYWKVDTAGRQLPYIDRVTHETLQDRGAMLFSFIGGDLLLQNRYVEFKDMPLFAGPVADGTLEVLNWIAAGSNGLCIMVNQTYTADDEFIRELLRAKKFRFALSHALPREEIRRLFYFGLGTPRQPAPIRQSPYYQAGRKFARTALDYDLDKANRLLDELGLTRRGPEGFRLRPNGEPIRVTVDHAPSTEMARIAEYICQRGLQPLGIRGIVKPATGQRGYAGLEMLSLRTGLDRAMQVLVDPHWYIPFNRLVYWATQYGLWYQSHGRRGWKPPEDIARIQRIYDRIKVCPDRQRRIELVGRILDIHAANLWLIGTVGELPEPVLVSPRAGNVPRNVVSDWLFMTPGNAHPEQFYCKW